MEALWYALSQMFWCLLLFVSGIILVALVVAFIWMVCNEVDKEKLSETKETR